MLGRKVTPAYKNNHGYYEYTHKFIPAVAGVAAAAAAVAAGICVAVAVKRKKKGKNTK